MRARFVGEVLTDVPREGADELAGLTLPELSRRALAALRRNLWLILLCSLLFGGLGATFALLQAPYYVARASIIIDPRVNEGMDPPAPTAVLADALVVDSEVEVLRSGELLRRVIDRLGLVATKRKELETDGAQIPPEEVLRQELVESLAKDFEIEREAQTYIIRISARADDPARAADLANALAESYFEAQLEKRLAQAEQAGSWLQGELDDMSSKVIAAELKVERFISGNDVPREDVVGAALQELDSTNQSLIAARARIRTAQSEIAAIDNALAAGAASGDEVLILQSQLIAALGGDQDLAARQMPAELTRLREMRLAQIEIANTEIAALDQHAADLKAEIATTAEKQVRLGNLQREATALQTQYEALLARFEQSRGEERFFQSSAWVIEHAAAPTEPANPGLPVIAATLTAGGLIVGLGLAFLREQLDDTLRRSDDVLDALGVAYFGPLPIIARRELAPLDPGLASLARSRLSRRQRDEIARLSYAASAPFSLLAETLRRVMLDLQRRRSSDGLVVAASSALSNEGKSFFAANLAFFLARQGYRVVLVDGDVRNPHLSRSFAPLYREAVPDAVPEASDADGTMGTAVLEQNLRLLYRRDTAALNDAERQMTIMPALLERARRDADFVVLDTGPLAYVSDSASLSTVIDSSVLLASWGRTSSATIRRVLRLNGALAGTIVGACLSRVPATRLQRYEFIPAGNAYYSSARLPPGDRP